MIRQRRLLRGALAGLVGAVALASVAEAGQRFRRFDDRGDRWNDRRASLVKKLETKGDYTILLTALETAGLTETVREADALTILAPTDRAFVDLLDDLDVTAEELLALPNLADILLYHVLPGKVRRGELAFETVQTTVNGAPVLALLEGFTLTVGGAEVEQTFGARNGVIHSIDAVLLPPEGDVEIGDVVDLLAFDGRFTTLLAALDTAGLTQTVRDAEALTVFAPTDDAFADLLDALGVTPAELLANPDLAAILTYHVVPGERRALSLLIERNVETLQGSDVFVSIGRGGISINDSGVINPNVKAPNGIVHTIDAVLLP